MDAGAKSTGELLDAWRDATRAAELADSLSSNASDASTLADEAEAAAEEIAKLAEQAATAAERAAVTARTAALRAKALAQFSRERRTNRAERADAAHLAEDDARDAYHTGVADAARRQGEEKP